jgi:hypothetical protein
VEAAGLKEVVLNEIWVLAWRGNLVTRWRQWWQLKSWVTFFEDNSMHSVHRSVISAAREVLLALDSTRHDVANEGVFLGKVRREVHLLPLKPFSDSESWKSKIRADSCSFNEI